MAPRSLRTTRDERRTSHVMCGDGRRGQATETTRRCLMMRPTGSVMPSMGARRGTGDREARPKHRVFENVHEASAPKSSVASETGVSPSDRVLERGIQIGPWTITVMHGSIANAVEVDQLSDLLGVTPPEMPFPRNALVLQHAPSGFSY